MRFRIASLALAMGAACLPPMARTPAPVLADLDPAQVTAIDLVFVGGRRSACVHGAPPQLRAVVTYADGKRVSTWAAGEPQDGKLDFAELEWGSDFGVVDAAGQLRFPGDPFAALGRTATVQVRVPGRPELSAEAELAPRFDCPVEVYAGGVSGASGRSGWSGQGGRAGAAATSTARAGDGGDGGNGERGGDGGHGGHAPRVEVALAYADGGDHGRLVVARVGSAVFLAAEGQPIVVSAAGGAGGSGGRGGDGGAGGSGGAASAEGSGPGGNGGRGGDGGDGGNGGDGGDGGEIVVRFDGRHPELAELVRGTTAGGPGGAAGWPGRGGSGGTGGSSADGQRGRAGPAGRDGQAGAEGRPGRNGAGVRAEGADVGGLFGAEIASGLPIGGPR